MLHVMPDLVHRSVLIELERVATSDRVKDCEPTTGRRQQRDCASLKLGIMEREGITGLSSRARSQPFYSQRRPIPHDPPV